MKKYLHPLLASLLVLGLVLNMLFVAPAQGLAEQWTAAGGVKQISAGWGHTCAIAKDNKVYCWGDNLWYGMVGNNSSTARYLTPVPVDTSGALAGKTIKKSHQETSILAH